MTPRDREAITAAARKVAAGWPPLTQNQLNRIALLLRASAPPHTGSSKAA
jgi:hypothetical protein